MTTHATQDTVLIAADHAGVDVKRDLGAFLASLGYDVRDLGPHDTTSVDYPDYAHRLAERVVRGDGAWGARAALVHEAYTARMAREHNDANIVVLGARVLGPELMRECLRAFASAGFTPGDDGRHRRRVDKLEPS